MRVLKITLIVKCHVQQFCFNDVLKVVNYSFTFLGEKNFWISYIYNLNGKPLYLDLIIKVLKFDIYCVSSVFKGYFTEKSYKFKFKEKFFSKFLFYGVSKDCNLTPRTL